MLTLPSNFYVTFFPSSAPNNFSQREMRKRETVRGPKFRTSSFLHRDSYARFSFILPPGVHYTQRWARIIDDQSEKTEYLGKTLQLSREDTTDAGANKLFTFAALQLFSKCMDIFFAWPLNSDLPNRPTPSFNGIKQ